MLGGAVSGVGDYARAIEVKTANFAAVVGGRYIVESGGLVSITDPAGTTAGQSYEVWIGSGTIWFNGAGTVYSASRFSIRRRYNGSAWATPAPTITDTLTVGSGTWSGGTFTGPQIFSSTTRPSTPSVTGPPSASSQITREDTLQINHFSRRLFPNIVGTTGGGGSGATSRRAAAAGIVDGDLSTSTTLGAFYRINLITSGSGVSSLMGVVSSGAVNLSAKWSLFSRVSLQMGTNAHIYLCVGTDGASGVPSSGTGVGFEITSATSARLFRNNAGAANYSSAGTLTGITTSAATSDLFFWLDNDGAGNLSLFFAEKAFASAIPSKPASALCTLAGVASGWSGSEVSMYLRATAASPSVFTSLQVRDVIFSEF